MLPVVSTPAKPPPATTNVRSATRSFSAQSVPASSRCSIRRFRSAMASPRDFIRMCFISEAGDVEKIYHATESEDNVVVFQRMSVAVKPVRDDGTTLCQVDRQNLALKESNVPQHLTDRIDDMRYIEVTCRNFMKHRREQEEVFLTNQ